MSIPTLKEVAGHKELTNDVSISELKMGCMDLAVRIKQGMECPEDEILNLSKEIFNWIISKPENKQQ